jgi:hypothetical protein
MVTCQGQDPPLCTNAPLAYFNACSSPVAMPATTLTRWSTNTLPFGSGFAVLADLTLDFMPKTLPEMPLFLCKMQLYSPYYSFGI